MERLQQALRHMETEEIATLDLAMFKDDDLLNIILQRSEVIADQPRPGRIIRSWSAGDSAPAMEVIDKLGSQIAARAAAFVYVEYCELHDLLVKLAPRRIADIGCGYAFFDLFAHRDFGQSIDLIDIEHSEHRHFHFKPEGSGYASLVVAREFLTRNGCPDDRITTTNPQNEDLLLSAEVDLAVSFLSCGFHYPWETYLDYFGKAVRPGGSVILDLRATALDDTLRAMSPIGEVSVLVDVAGGKGKRIHLQKRKQAAGQVSAA